MTGIDLISGSMRLLGVLASGEAPSSSEATDALSALNDMIDTWSNESLLIPNKVREVFPLVAGKGSYTMGPAGDFNTSRPMKIEKALVQLVSSNPSIEIPMDILTEEQYAGIILKGNQSTYPLYLYEENTFPLDTVNVWSVPSAVNNIVLYSWKPLTQVASLSTVLSLPPGYQRALRYSLAVEIAPEYGKEPSSVVVEIASAARAAVKRMNSKPLFMRVDESITAKSKAWNWMTGEPT